MLFVLPGRPGESGFAALAWAVLRGKTRVVDGGQISPKENTVDLLHRRQRPLCDRRVHRPGRLAPLTTNAHPLIRSPNDREGVAWRKSLLWLAQPTPFGRALTALLAPHLRPLHASAPPVQPPHHRATAPDQRLTLSSGAADLQSVFQ